MLFSYNWLQEYIKGKLPAPAKLAELLNMHAFEVEALRQAQGKKDWILDIAVLPNRAHDCLSHTGMAREIAAICKLKLQLPKTKQIKVQKGGLAPLKVRVQSTELVPRYTALLIEGVTIGKSPTWIAERLEAVGVNSINNVVDLTNFIMLETGQPLHAFDYEQIEGPFDSAQGKLMNVREAKEGEKLETLDNQIFSLPRGALVIEDAPSTGSGQAKRLIDLAGIKGGKVSAISSGTKHILLQAANFNAATIYRTKSQLKYTTQAADIYAHQIDPNLTMEALERAYALCAELGIGGKIVQVVDLYPKSASWRTKRIALDMQFASSILGIPLSQKEAKRILESLDCQVALTKNRLQVTCPTRRLDLTMQEDLVEEIGRIVGYETIPAAFPIAPITPPSKNIELLWLSKIRNALKGLGFTEVYNHSFIGDKDFSPFAYSATDKEKLVEVENPLSSEFSHLRDSLLENLLKNVRDNQKKTETIRIFEVGNTFRRHKGKFVESNMLSALIYNGSFYEVKGVCDFILNGLGISSAWYDEYQATSEESRATIWHKGKSAEIKVDGEKIGFLGEISSRVNTALKLSKPVGALHLNLQKLILLASEEISYQVPSRFPASTRDIAILVPFQTKVAEVMNAMNGAGGPLVRDIDLFDMYEGEHLAQGKKNLAFHIIYESSDRTLTSKEVDTLHNQIIKAVEENPEWEVRK
ncbi:MAG: phenylalanine--tRNA ligase subunit beta [Candidatus Wildermuthbacteria bacterium]|nr:phenylalanine--tRNA ligase subunit beta [Candidatus Wildermuthbacteria bacterium]